MKRAIVALTAAGVLLTGCASSPQQKAAAFDDQNKLPFILTTPTGGKVACFFIFTDRGGGPTCDWVGYHQTYDGKK